MKNSSCKNQPKLMIIYTSNAINQVVALPVGQQGVTHRRKHQSSRVVIKKCKGSGLLGEWARHHSGHLRPMFDCEI